MLFKHEEYEKTIVEIYEKYKIPKPKGYKPEKIIDTEQVEDLESLELSIRHFITIRNNSEKRINLLVSDIQVKKEYNY